MSRTICPFCHSSTGFGSNICFKCGVIHTTDGKLTPGFLTDAVALREVIKLREDLILDVKKFPARALSWLYKNGIYDDVIQRQRIGYCSEANRVLVPAFDANGVLHFYQMRHIEHELGNEIKYYSKGKLNMFTIHYHDFTNNTVVIVEDHISAIRLRKHGNVVALSGTKLKNEFCKELARKYSKFIFWLDSDKPGQDGTYSNFIKLKYYCNQESLHSLFKTNICKTYSFNKVKCDIIAKDPKCYLDSEIESILKHEVIECD